MMLVEEQAPAAVSLPGSPARHAERRVVGDVTADDRVRLSYIPGLDGLRAVAISGVLLFHLHLPYSSLGWAGVELFFVISGFLITRILLETRDRAGYFKSFYLRRALRIFPIYYLVVGGYAFADHWSGGAAASAIPYYLTYLQTITQLRQAFTDAPLLGHTWTLAIEEQFYVVWPFIVYLLRGRLLLATTLAMIVLSSAARYLLHGHWSPFLVDGWIGVQLDTFALGALLAYATASCSRATVQRWATVALLIGSAGLIGLVAAVGLTPFWTPYSWAPAAYGPWVITILALASVGAIGLVTTEHRLVRWLGAAPLISIGKLSYGIYLYHPFVFRAVAASVPPLGGSLRTSVVVVPLSLAVTLLVAKLSWMLIEQPLLSLKRRVPEPRAASLAA